MAALFDDEGNEGTYRNDDNNIASSSTQYSFPALKDWLNKYDLSHLEAVLKHQGFESLHSLIMLNANDLDELCGEIKENLKIINSKLTLKQKATFKREIIQQQLKYNEFLSGKTSNNNNKKNNNENISPSFVVTKQERQALQILNQQINTFQSVLNVSQNTTNNAKQLHSSIIISISQISKQFELSLNQFFQVSYDKYIKGHYIFNNQCNKLINTLKDTKKNCYDALSMESHQEMDVVKKIDEKTKNVGKELQDFISNFDKEFIVKECFSGLLMSMLNDINFAKMIQQFVAFFVSQIRPTIQIMVNDVGSNLVKHGGSNKEDKKHNLLLLILPHAVDYIQDIENELKQRNIKIVKKMENIHHDKAKTLLLKQWSSFINKTYEKEKNRKEEKAKPEDEEDEKLKEYSLDEIRKHNTEQTLWVILHNRVYDVTKFQLDHPGGPDVLLDIAGQNATEEFENILHTKKARKMTKKYLIGKVKNTKPTNLFESVDEYDNNKYNKINFESVDDNDIKTFFDKSSVDVRLQFLVWRHLNVYFKNASNQCMAWKIELKYSANHHSQHIDDFVDDNFNIWYPSILGEYSSTFLPDTMNGKFMKIWTSKQDEKQLNAKINLGFTDVIQPKFVKDVLNIQIDTD